MNSLRHKNTRCDAFGPLNKKRSHLATVSQTRCSLGRRTRQARRPPGRPRSDTDMRYLSRGRAPCRARPPNRVVTASVVAATRDAALVVRARPACREAGRRDRRDSTVASVVSPLQAMPSGIRGRGSDTRHPLSDTSKTSHHRRQSAYMNMCFRCCSGALLVCWPDPSRDEVKSSQVTLDLKIDLT